MINILISCAIVIVALFMFVLLFGAQMERHLRNNIKKWAQDAERREAGL